MTVLSRLRVLLSLLLITAPLAPATAATLTFETSAASLQINLFQGSNVAGITYALGSGGRFGVHIDTIDHELTVDALFTEISAIVGSEEIIEAPFTAAIGVFALKPLLDSDRFDPFDLSDAPASAMLDFSTPGEPLALTNHDPLRELSSAPIILYGGFSTVWLDPTGTETIVEVLLSSELHTPHPGAALPEPATIVLLGAGVGFVARRGKRKSAALG